MRVRTISLVALYLALLSIAISGQERPVRTVLTIHWGAEDFPGISPFDEGIRNALSSLNPPINTYAEYLESEAFPAERASLALRDYISQKFAGRRIDLVIANSTPSLRFALQHRAELFPGAPMLFVAGRIPEDVRTHSVTGVTGVVSDVTFAETLELALKLHPTVKRVFVVAQQPPSEAYDERVRAALEPFSKRVELTFVNEPSLSGVLGVVKAIPAQSVILYTRYTAEDRGRIVYADEFARILAETAPVPVYSMTDRYLGKGVVGGIMRSSHSTGIRIGQMAREILDGKPAAAIPVERVPSVATFDWRQVRRWGINPSLLPANAQIRFRDSTVWESYRWYIVGAFVIVTAQLLVIAGLVAQAIKQRRAERTLRQREATLRASYERARNLTGRLINAQEAARAGIAQDLHDDVSQRLVFVAMALSSLKNASGKIQDVHTQQILSELENDTQTVLDGIRNVSHVLHPTTLRLVGIEAALKAHCTEVERRHGVQVAFGSDGDLRELHPDAAMGLFRITQEALRNAIGHGEARRCEVILARRGANVELTVTDDGRGFDLDHMRRDADGLGLVLMEERAHSFGANLEIVSAPGRGTTVRVRGPVQLTASPRVKDASVRGRRRVDEFPAAG